MTERMERKQYSECSSHESKDSLCRASTGGIEGYNYVRNVRKEGKPTTWHASL